MSPLKQALNRWSFDSCTKPHVTEVLENRTKSIQNPETNLYIRMTVPLAIEFEANFDWIEKYGVSY